MSRKILNRNTIENSFLESSDENDECCLSNWKLYSSSDDESLKHKSEVLWSRDNDYPLERDYFRDAFDSFSNVTGRTVSSCSWHNDEFDMRSTNRVKESLDAIDDLLYENTKSALISQDVNKECTEWAEKFPYFRLKGEQIIKPLEDSVLLYSSPAQSSMPHCSESSSKSLQIQGKKLVIHTPDRYLKKGGAEIAPEEPNKLPDFFEEVIENEGEYEECLALDESEICDLPSVLSKNESIATSSFIKTLHEKIVERLTLEMWPSILNALQKVDEMKKCDGTIDFQLPPIVAAAKQPKPSYTRPKTEGMNLPLTEFPKLSSILSISPKVLQKKSSSVGSQIPKARPTSEISLFRRNPAVISMNQRNEDGVRTSKGMQKNPTLTHSQGKNTSNRVTRKAVKDHENICFFLPSLEEDFSAPSDILRGFHIEPETRELTSRSLLSTQLSEGPSKKQECFLPPIEDRDPIASNMKLAKNLFTFYGSSFTGDRGGVVEPAFGKQITYTSRPNTSSSKKVIGGRGLSEQKLLKDAHHVNNKDNKELEASAQNFRLSKASTEHPVAEDINAERSVSLFPIVTSLVPYKEKSYTTVKKGLFHAFVGRKR